MSRFCERAKRSKAIINTIIPQAGRILDRQNMPVFHRTRRAGKRRLTHRLNCYLVVVQKATDTDLTGAVTTQTADRNTRKPNINKPAVQKSPPFLSRSSPK